MMMEIYKISEFNSQKSLMASLQTDIGFIFRPHFLVYVSKIKFHEFESFLVILEIREIKRVSWIKALKKSRTKLRIHFPVTH